MNTIIKKKKIILLPSDDQFIREINNKLDNDEQCSWIYLGKNVITYQKVGKILNPFHEAISYGEELQRLARENREKYIEFIGTINARQTSPFWWLTSLSEKNPFISDVFLHFCYLLLINQHITTNPVNLLIITESAGLLKSLSKNLQNRPDIELLTFEHRFADWLSSARKTGRRIYFKSDYLFSSIYRLVLSRFFGTINRKIRPEFSKKPGVIIYSWADSRSFIKKSKYSEIITGNLGEDLNNNGITISYLVNILPTIRYHHAIKELLKRTDTFYLLEEFITISDIIKSFRINRFQRINERKIPLWNDLDVLDVILEEIKNNQCTNRSNRAYLYLQASKRMIDQISFTTFIYPFENHIWEKMVCIGMKQKKPGIFLSSYAHSIVNPMYLPYSVSIKELDIIPLPDRIIVNGKRSREVLINSGFQETDIIIAGAVRYPDTLHCTISSGIQIKKEIPVLLVASPAGISESIELTEKIIRTFTDTIGLQIIIKPHPINPIEKILKYLPDLPPHITVDNTPIDKLLDVADLLIYMDTTVSIQALFRGIPVLHIKSELNIDINPLEGYENIPSVSHPHEIRDIAINLINSREEHCKKYQAIASDFFEPVHDNYIGLFLGTDKNEVTDL